MIIVVTVPNSSAVALRIGAIPTVVKGGSTLLMLSLKAAQGGTLLPFVVSILENIQMWSRHNAAILDWLLLNQLFGSTFDKSWNLGSGLPLLRRFGGSTPCSFSTVSCLKAFCQPCTRFTWGLGGGGPRCHAFYCVQWNVP